MSRSITPVERQAYEDDGVVHLAGFLSGSEIAALEAAYEFTFSHPGASARSLYPEEGGRFYQDGSNMANWDYYAALLRGHPLSQLCRDLWGQQDVWFMNEQIFLKESGRTRRTPWHQDASYTPYDGRQLAIVWINFRPVSLENSLEFVRGSHRGPLYNGSAFDPADDTIAMASDSRSIPLPNIQQEREKWDIVSFAVEPGDLVVFHNRTLHGGAATEEGGQRRTLSLRFFGDDVVRVADDAAGDGQQGSQLDADLMSGWGGLVRSLSPGEPLSSNPGFRKL